MVQISEERKQIVAGGVGLIGGLGAGIATMAGPQAYPRVAPWIWEGLFWFGIALFVGAIVYLLYEYWVRPRRAGKPKVDPLQIIILVAAVVLLGALILQLIRGPYVTQVSATPAGSIVAVPAVPPVNAATELAFGPYQPKEAGELIDVLNQMQEFYCACGRTHRFFCIGFGDARPGWKAG